MSDSRLSHYDREGRARMVDIGDKAVTRRRAQASGRIYVSQETLALIEAGQVPKGHPFEIARLAGITAAKRTAELIPLCHPLRLTFVDLEVRPQPMESCLEVVATVVADDRTGVEMEALVGCTTALLTIYDMLKAVDRAMIIGDVRLLKKTGGRSDHHPNA